MVTNQKQLWAHMSIFGQHGLLGSARLPNMHEGVERPAFVRVVDLGRMDYKEALARQLAVRDALQTGRGEDTIFLVEHPPVATLGRRGRPEDVFDAALPVVVVDRGGKATYHGDGQLVIYPVVHLGEGCRDIRAWVQHIEAFVVALLTAHGIRASARLDEPGVWTAAGRKIASVGVAVQQWVSTHGVAINVSTDLREFERINPCGLGAAVMTSMQNEGSSATLEMVRKWAMAHAESHFMQFAQHVMQSRSRA